ncbi:MAG: ketopantoate reductase family protein [Clostridiaceae bacterium]|nr:ketopantoate reductase family protein [Clostridiaceae bacterium]
MLNEIKTVHIIGLGAVGATYGSILHDYDSTCVKVIIDDERLSKYKSGLVINGKRYFFDLQVPKVDDPKAELIIIAVKGLNLQETIHAITPLVGSDTIILSLLNGITSEEILSETFGRDKVLHGFSVGIDALRENGEVKFSTMGKIVFGEYYPEVKGKAALVAEIFSKAGINYSIPDDIRKEMWWKFMLNVGINQTSAILGIPYGVYASSTDAQKLLAAACREVLPLAEKEGISLSEADIDKYIKLIQTLSPQSKTSMLQDIEAGRKTEVESFALAVMDLGKKHNIPTPVNEMLYLMLRVLEQK